MVSSNPTIALTALILGSTLSMVNFSYDAGVVNQLLLSVKFFEYFQLNSTWIGLNVAIVNIGNLVASPIVGPLMDWVGRKKAIWMSNLLAIIGVAIQASAQNIGMLLAGRAILGFSLGITGVCGPTLVAETTPGRLFAITTNASMLGLPLVGVMVSAGGIGIYESDSDWGWRGAILGEAIGPLLSSLFLLLALESPRWLIFKNRSEEARKVLEGMNSLPTGPERDAVILAEYEEMAQTIEYERQTDENIKALVAKRSDRSRFVIAILTNIFYQTSGANTLPYFFTLVLGSIGITETYTLLYLNLGLTAWGVVSLCSGLWITHRFGSKTIMLANTTVMTISLALLAVFSGLGYDKGRGVGALVTTFVFWWASCSCWMILEYTYPVEILRFSLRGKGTALAQMIGYAFQLTLNYTLPMALKTIGWKFYLINAAWDAGIVMAIWFLFVEIKGRTLEEVDALFDGDVHFLDSQNIEVIHGISGKSGAISEGEKAMEEIKC
ncbi:general substrate transporter [Xylariaceae sp. FL0662B]|nr:general substrate transporter [Xylariaceae sp. FL0662B]